MRLRCFECGESVSTEVPADTVVRATLLCPECLALADQPALETALKSIEVARRARARLARQSGEA